jgi:glutathione S-transferase
MYTLFYAPGTASLVVHWLLIELDVPHELRRLDLDAREHKRPEYLALNPNGVVPTLLIDGKPAYESAALVLYLADAHPQAGFAPANDDPARASYLQWIVHLANTLQPAFRDWFYPHEAAGESYVDAAKAAARARIEATWDRLDAQLGSGGPYLLGERISSADFLLTMLMRWSRNMPKPATEWPHLRALAEKMKARPSFRRLYALENLTEWA